MLIIKIILIAAIVLLVLFVLSMVVYFFNLDMKFAAMITPVMNKHYDRVKKNRHV